MSKEYLFSFDEQEAWRNAERQVSWSDIVAELIIDKKPIPTDRHEQHRLMREATMEVVENMREKFDSVSARLAGMSSVYELADRVLTNQDLSVVMRPLGTDKPVAWTDGKQVVFNTDAISGNHNSDEFITALHGINFHEVGHALFTPRQNSSLMKWVVSNRYLTAFNYLEDNRIENMLVIKYPSIKNFLVLNLINNTINKAQDTPENIYPVIAGRNFLPSELYQSILTDFVSEYGSDLAKTVSDITNEFASLSLPKHEQQAKDLIKKFAELFNLQDPEQDPQQGGGQGEGEQGEGEQQQQGSGQQDNNKIANTSCSGRNPMGSGRPQAGSEQDKLQGKNNGQGQYDFEQKQQPSNSDSDSQERGDGGSLESDGDSDKQSDKQGVSKAVNKYESIINELNNSNEVKQQVQDTKKAVKNADSKVNILPKAPTKTEPVTDDMRQASRKFADELIRSEIDTDPSWLKQQPSGRLNIQRAMNMDINTMNTVFDRWTYGDQTVDIESAILIDNSGSMAGSEIYYANQYAWVIKRAIEQVQGKCATLTFSTYSKRLYDSNEKASPTEYRWIGSHNDTNPLPALTQASINMGNSQAPIKTLFILTDGSWGYSDQCDKVISDMREQGVVVTVVFLNGWARYQLEKGESTHTLSDYQREYGHGADVFSLIGDPQQLPNIAKDVLLTALKKLEAH